MSRLLFESPHLYFHHVGLSHSGKEIVVEALNGEPKKRLRTNAVRGIRRYSSIKNGYTVQAENSQVMSAILACYETVADVKQYLDYAVELALDYKHTKGTRIVRQDCPQFLVLRENSAGFEHWQSDKWLAEKAATDPDNYWIDENGIGHFRPIEDTLDGTGLYYRIFPYSTLDPIFTGNIEFEFDYLTAEPDKLPDLSSNSISSLTDYVAQHQGITLDELIDEIGRLGLTVGHFYALRATNRLYYDRYAVALWAQEAVHVFTNEDYARAFALPRYAGVDNVTVRTVKLEPGNELVWQGQIWIFLNAGATHVSLQAPEELESPSQLDSDSSDANSLKPNDSSKRRGKIIPLPRDEFERLIQQGEIENLISVDETAVSQTTAYEDILITSNGTQIRDAVQRLNTINDEGTPITDSDRTKRQWRKQFRDAERTDGYGFLGLIDKRGQRGNRKRRLPEKTIDIMAEHLPLYESTYRFSISATWGAIVDKCEEAQTIAPSYETVRLLIHSRNIYEQEKARWGTKAAYDAKPTLLWLDAENPRDGNRPFHRGHIDHWEVPVTARDSRTGVILGKPHVSILLDAWTREVLAFYLTFEDNSYRNTLMLIRECVRRHKQLPTWIVMDQGSDFNGTYVESALALCASHKVERPAGDPRSGNPLERVFNTVETEWAAGLLGSTKPRENPRKMSPEVDPDKNAVWTLPKLYRRLHDFFYRKYNNTGHTSLGNASPYAVRAHGLRFFGDRNEIRCIDYDAGFIFATLPSTDSGTAKVMKNNGRIKIINEEYGHPLMGLGDVAGQNVDVRYEPFDRSIAFAFIKGEWRLCKARDANLRGLSERFVQLRSEEAKARDKIPNTRKAKEKKARDNAKFRLALLKEEEELSENLRLELMRQNESRTVRELMGLDTLDTLKSMGYEVPEQVPLTTNSIPPEPASVADADSKPKNLYRPGLLPNLEV